MSDLYSDDVYQFELPVWSIAFASRIADRGIGFSIPRLNAEGFPEFMPVFTDEDLAARYIAEAAAGTDLRPVEIENNEYFASIMDAMLARGTQYVGVDPAAGGANRVRIGRIAEYLAAIRGGQG